MATREELKQVFANGQMATGEKFANLIDSMKLVQLPVVDPQALGTSLSFIDSISQDADGKITVTKKRMSPTVGSFQFVANDATAEAAFTAVGAKYSGAISGVSPSADTLGVILLMNDDDTTPTKTMMITTEEVTPATNPATYQFVYVGDLQSALPSGVLTIADIVNGFIGGVDKVLSAEAGASLNERKINKVDKNIEEVWTEVEPIDDSYPKPSTYLRSDNALEGPLSDFTVLKCAVNAGDTYYITGRTGTGNSSTLAAFYNSEDSLISGSKIDSGVANVIKTRYGVTAPATAAYIRIQGYLTTSPLCETKEIVETIISNNQAKLDSIGLVEDLETTEKTTVVGAINEVLGDTIPEQITYDDISLSDAEKGYYSNIFVGSTRQSLSGTTSDYLTKDVAVQVGEIYIGSSRLGGNSIRQFIFWDNSNKCISYINTGDSKYKENVKVTVPENAVLMSFCGALTSITYPASLKRENHITASERLNDLEEEVDTLDVAVETTNQRLDTIIDVQQSPNIFDKTKMKKGYIDGTTGIVNSIYEEKHKNSGLIEIEPNTYYYLSGRSSYEGLHSIRCIKEDGSTRVKVLAAANGQEYSNWNLPNDNNTGVVRNGQFKTPATAKYVQFNVIFNNNGSADAVMLQKVGSTYNPDFLPGDYKPFGEITKIKEDVLPDFNIDETLKVLLIGSSHGRNTITQFPFIAYNSGINVEVGNVYLGSLTMQRIVGMDMRGEKFGINFFKNGESTSEGNLSLAQIWKYDDWDYIVVQRSASDDEIWTTTQNEADNANKSYININYGTQLPAVYMSHNEALQYILNSIRANAIKNPTVLFNSGFAKTGEGIDTTQTNNKITTAGYMKEQFGLDVVPVGIAVRNARNTFMRYIGKYAGSGNNANQIAYDDEHLDFGIGCYIASACLLEFILRKEGKSIINLKGYGNLNEVSNFTGVPLEGTGNYTQPTEETMMVAKACAMCACNTPDAVSTKLQNRFKWKITYNLGTGITSSNTKGYSSDTDKYTTTLSGTVNSVVITKGAWDRRTALETLTEGTDYTYDNATQTITIPSVEGDITITVS